MKLAVLMLIVAGLVVVGATPALACSCAPSSPAEVAERSDAAFVGTYLGRTEPAQTGPYLSTSTEVVNHFSVERVVKGGPIAGTVDVLAALSSASCGLEFGVGQRAGLGLTRDGAGWHSNLCNQAEPDALLALAQPANPPPPPPAPAPPAASPKVGPSPGEPSVSPVPTPVPSPSPTPSPTGDEVGLASDDRSGPPWIPILAVLGLVVVGAGIALRLRSRGSPQ
jgi:hypothetical protein